MLRYCLRWGVLLLLVACGMADASEMDPDASNTVRRAMIDYRGKNYVAAESAFREVLRSDPSNLLAQVYLGHSLFYQNKCAEAVMPYEKAREIESKAKVLSVTERRVLTDQLVMSYGISGQFEKAHALLSVVIAEDPGYPLNYYNLACTFAEQGNKAGMLANLEAAYQRKDGMLAGEHIPDPRTDSSFRHFTRDADFVRLLKKLGWK